MKKKHLNVGRWISGLCTAGVAVLGFGCDSDNGECMYGMPTGTFEIKGTVTDMNGSPVGNASIRITEPKYDSKFYIDAAKSDSEGDYKVDSSGFPIHAVKVVCLPEQPTLEPDSTVVELEYKDRDKKNSWDMGHAEKTVNFKLKEKKGTE